MYFLTLLCLTNPLCAHYTSCCESCSWRVLLWASGGSRSRLIWMCLSDFSPTSLPLQLSCLFSSILYSFMSLCMSVCLCFLSSLSDDGLWLSVSSVTVTLWSGLERQRCGWPWNSRNRLRNIVLIRLGKLGLEGPQCLVLPLMCKSV